MVWLQAFSKNFFSVFNQTKNQTKTTTRDWVIHNRIFKLNVWSFFIMYWVVFDTQNTSGNIIRHGHSHWTAPKTRTYDWQIRNNSALTFIYIYANYRQRFLFIYLHFFFSGHSKWIQWLWCLPIRTRWAKSEYVIMFPSLMFMHLWLYRVQQTSYTYWILCTVLYRARQAWVTARFFYHSRRSSICSLSTWRRAGIWSLEIAQVLPKTNGDN